MGNYITLYDKIKEILFSEALMISLDNAKKVFDNFVQQFDTTDPKIALKIRHTYGVVDACEYLAHSMKLSKEDYKLALLIGLLHDIGRFEQLTRFDSYDDTLLPHAEAGLDVLFNQGWIRKFIDTDIYDEIIYHAIKNHSIYAIDSTLSGQALLHAQLIRDADKLDNFRVKTEDSIPAMLDVTEEELGKEQITDAIFQCFSSHKPILKSDRKTHMDMWISYLAFIFDFNFPSSFQFVLEHDYIVKNIDRIPYSNPDTEAKMRKIKEIAQKYCEDQINGKLL